MSSKADTTLLPFRGTARHSCVPVLENKAKGKGTKQQQQLHTLTLPPSEATPKNNHLLPWGHIWPQKKKKNSKFPEPPFGHHPHLCQKYSIVLLPVIHQMVGFFRRTITMTIQHDGWLLSVLHSSCTPPPIFLGVFIEIAERSRPTPRTILGRWCMTLQEAPKDTNKVEGIK